MIPLLWRRNPLCTQLLSYNPSWQCGKRGTGENVEAQILIGFKWHVRPIKKISFQKIKENWMKYFPPKDTLHLLLPPANHALSCTHCHHVSFRRGDTRAVLASLKLRIFLLYFPKWMYQLNQLVNWKLLCCEPTQAFCVVNGMMQIADKLDKTGHFTVVSCRGMEPKQAASSVLSQRATAAHPPHDTTSFRGALPSFLLLGKKKKILQWFF